jgi:hypothetical protein
MRNTLQLNNGEGVFTEAGRFAGITMTDWSWATLIADFDNSGYNDIYITNGFPRFYTNLDYLNNILWRQFPDEDLPDDPELKYRLVQQMEKVEMHNFAFRNSGDFRFPETTEEWGLKKYTVSGGAVYADLNNNGALDLVVDLIGGPASAELVPTLRRGGLLVQVTASGDPTTTDAAAEHGDGRARRGQPAEQVEG